MATTALDPTTSINSGGVRTFSNTDGTTTNSYRIYYQTNNPNAFSKANGLGGLVAFCHASPVEIDNRVWIDTNGNGIQDPNEPAIAGVTVNLYAADGTTLLLTTTTDANGNYSFPVSAYTSYVVKLDNPADYSASGPLAGFQLTTAFQDTINGIADSKGFLPQAGTAIGTGNYPQATVAVHNPGQNDFTFDFGFSALPDLALTKTNSGGSTFQVGQSVSYTLQATNNTNAGPVVSSHSIVVTDPVPAGLTNITATGAGWSYNVSSTTSPATVAATYTGPYPVTAGEALPPITITGTLTSAAIGSLNNTAIVSTLGDTLTTNNSGTDGITVAAAPTPTPVPPTPTSEVTPTPILPTSTPTQTGGGGGPSVTPTSTSTPPPVTTPTPTPTPGGPGLPPTGGGRR